VVGWMRKWEPIAVVTRSAVVPFYLYDLPELDVFRSCNATPHKNHRGEFYFFKQLENHPWRVEESSQAVVVVVPIPVSSYIRGGCPHELTANVFENAVNAIRNSETFQRHNGWDHVLVGSDWRIHHRMPTSLKEIAGNFTVGHTGYFGNSPWRCTISVAYTSGAERSILPHEVDYELWAKRKYGLFFHGQTEKNSGYHIRRVAMDNLPGFRTNITGYDSNNVLMTSSVRSKLPPCGDGLVEGCKEKSSTDVFHQRLRQSKFQLFLRGDDYSSARMYDGLLEMTPNIVFSDEIWTNGLPARCQTPWEVMTFRGSEARFVVDPVGELNRLFRDINEDTVKIRLDAMRKHRDNVLWESAHSRAASMVLTNTARRCLPDSIVAGRLGKRATSCDFLDVTKVF